MSRSVFLPRNRHKMPSVILPFWDAGFCRGNKKQSCQEFGESDLQPVFGIPHKSTFPPFCGLWSRFPRGKRAPVTFDDPFAWINNKHQKCRCFDFTKRILNRAVVNGDGKLLIPEISRPRSWTIKNRKPENRSVGAVPDLLEEVSHVSVYFFCSFDSCVTQCEPVDQLWASHLFAVTRDLNLKDAFRIMWAMSDAEWSFCMHIGLYRIHFLCPGLLGVTATVVSPPWCAFPLCSVLSGTTKRGNLL